MAETMIFAPHGGEKCLTADEIDRNLRDEVKRLREALTKAEAALGLSRSDYDVLRSSMNDLAIAYNVALVKIGRLEDALVEGGKP